MSSAELICGLKTEYIIRCASQGQARHDIGKAHVMHIHRRESARIGFHIGRALVEVSHVGGNTCAMLNSFFANTGANIHNHCGFRLRIGGGSSAMTESTNPRTIHLPGKPSGLFNHLLSGYRNSNMFYRI